MHLSVIFYRRIHIVWEGNKLVVALLCTVYFVRNPAQLLLMN